jgi:hypothetical protein
MTGVANRRLIASGAFQTMEYQENMALYTGSLTVPFYFDGNLNFGYGYNMTANWPSAAQTFQQDGMPQSIIDYINSVGGPSNASVVALNNLAAGENLQNVAVSIATDIWNGIQNNILSGALGIDVSNVPAGALIAMTDMAYNGGLGSAAFGRGFLTDIVAGDYGAAAWELAANTAVQGQNGYENRLAEDAASMLGLTPNIDDGGNLVTTGTPDAAAVQTFVESAFNRTGSATSSLFEPGSMAQQLLLQAIMSEIDGIPPLSGGGSSPGTDPAAPPFGDGAPGDAAEHIGNADRQVRLERNHADWV